MRYVILIVTMTNAREVLGMKVGKMRSMKLWSGCALLALLAWPGAGSAQGVDLFEGEDVGDSGGLQIESASGGMSSSLAANAGKPGAGTKLKFVRRGGAIFVEAKVNGKPVYFHFDTGASITTLTPAFASAVGAAPGSKNPTITTKTANGLREARVGMISTLALGGKNLSNVTFTTCVSCGGKLAGQKRPIVGLLGMNVLGRYSVRMNDAEGVVELYPSMGHEERIADIRPWLTTKMQGFTTMSKDRKKRSRDWNYQVTIKNNAPRSVSGVVLELSCYLKGGGTRTASSKPVNIGARSSKKVVINTPFTRECEDFSSEYRTGRW